MKCTDLDQALRHVARLDARLGIALIHRTGCAHCALDGDVEELIAQMVEERFVLQLHYCLEHLLVSAACG